MENDLIQDLEQLSMNAWPSLQTMLYDGWVLRFAEGVARRSNSVSPIFGSSIDVEKKISFCENLYKQHNLPTIFKLTSRVFPKDLDDILTKSGYQKEAETSVQTCDLTHAQFETKPEIILSNELKEDWVQSFVELNEFNTEKSEIYMRILENIIPQTVYASYRISNQIVGCGLAVKQGDHIGLYDIIVDKEHRGVGLGYYIVTALMQWGKLKGASTSYLQVMLNNAVALHLYEKLGFKEQYQYWYRIQS
ncbi:MAG: GNAT family N-acetyltransferase [Candidatus Cloacimonetes bacterium]|nr:GNAT family N-acetyltransferase [Candidatus Cloacimonadota bacterium]